VASGYISNLPMGVLESKVPAEPLLLFISWFHAGMIATLWLSKKAKTVRAETRE
jgi:hypothetical protein